LPQNVLEIKITDSGPGISEDILRKLFGKFVSWGSKTELNKKGTGLGLFISKSIVQGHGGDIVAYNNENGIGASFVIKLPIRKKR